MSALLLTPAEARVVAALSEKALTTPDYYPMTVNGLMAACNQKTSRNPVMSLTEGEVGHALNTLEEKGLVSRDDSSARATKWRSRFLHQLLLKPATHAVLLTLLLRGAQTAAELRSNAAPLQGPADADAVQAALEDLADRAQPLVATLPRQPGQAAVRYAHLLCGEPAVGVAADEAPAARASSGPAEARWQNLEARLAALEPLEARVVALEQKLADLGG